MIGKEPEKTAVVAPVSGGVIADPEAAREMLAEYIRRIIPDVYFPPKIKAIVGIPTGLSAQERGMYEDVVFGASRRIKDIILIENVILSAVGIGLPLNASPGGFVINIGGGTTEVAALSLCGIISGCGLGIGGDVMDKAVLDCVADMYNLQLGLLTARKLKHDIGSLYPNDVSAQPVKGADLRTQTLGSAVVKASDLYTVLESYYVRIGEAAEKIINMCPPDVAAAFNRSGIYVCGGGAKIPGLEELLSDKSGFKAIVPPDPEYAVISGAGKLLTNKELLRKILEQK
jgi:rod shape-determining protein MreB